MALVGWLRYLDGRRDDEGRRTKDEGSALSSFVRSSFVCWRWWPILLLPLLAFGWVVSFALTAGLVAWQGRLLFPALPALAILLAVGIANVKVQKAESQSLSIILPFTFYILP